MGEARLCLHMEIGIGRRKARLSKEIAGASKVKSPRSAPQALPVRASPLWLRRPRSSQGRSARPDFGALLSGCRSSWRGWVHNLRAADNAIKTKL